MSLSTEDLAAISSMLDAKLDSVRVQEKRRRTFWIWFWVIIFVVSSVISGYMTKHYVEKFQAEFTSMEMDLQNAKLEYQQQLARSQEMQVERKKAEIASNYNGKQDQASYEAGLMSAAFRIIGESRELNERMSKLDENDLDGLVDATEDMNNTMQMALGTLGQVLLRNTDPNRNTVEENLLLGESGIAPVASPDQAQPGNDDVLVQPKSAPTGPASAVESVP